MSSLSPTTSSGRFESSTPIIRDPNYWNAKAKVDTAFTFWKTRIIAALRLWRAGHMVGLNHMQEAHRTRPEMYAAIVACPEDQLDNWPNITAKT